MFAVSNFVSTIRKSIDKFRCADIYCKCIYGRCNGELITRKYYGVFAFQEEFMTKVPKLFGSMVFNEQIMRERLPKDVFKALQNTIRTGKPITSDVADVDRKSVV